MRNIFPFISNQWLSVDCRFLAKNKSFPQRVSGVNQEFVATSDVGRAFYFRYNGGVRTEGGGLDDLPGVAAADSALNDYRLAEADFAPCVVDSHPLFDDP